MKLRTKFVALLMPLVMAPLLFLGNLSYTQLRDSAERQLLDEIDGSIGVIEQLVESKLETANANAQVLAASPAVARLFDNPPGEETGLRAFSKAAATFQATYTDHEAIAVYDAGGLPLALHAETTDTLPPSLQDDILLENRAAVIDLSPDDDAALFVSARVRAKERGTAGNVVLRVGLDDLKARLNEAGGQHFFVIARKDGTSVFEDSASADAPRAETVSRWVSDSRHSQGLQAEFGDASYFVKGTGLLGDLYLFAVMPAQEFAAASRHMGPVILLVTIAAILATAATLYLGLHHIVLRPLQRIRTALQNVGRDDEAIRLDTNRKDEIGELASAFAAMNERLQASNDHVEYLAYHDSLTGLPNRTLFREQLKSALSEARRGQQKLAVLFVDLDDFKRINDTLGHQVGDEILRRVSDTVARELRDSDLISRISTETSEHVIARLGGDEFIILLRNVADEYAPRSVARRLCKRLREPVIIDGNELYVSASVGISMYPDDSNSADDLIRNADAAMYHAKELGKNHFQYFSSSMNEAAATRLQMETKLRKALDLDQFELYFQPKVDPKTYSIIGAEALIRWHDPEVGVVPPDAFIGIAEDTGLIVPIGEWVLNKACIQLKEWQMRGMPPIAIAVNVSAIQVARQDLGFIVARALRNSGVKPKYLDIEITESALMSGGERTVQMLEELRALDVTVSLDDFGTGYSSLSYLRKFPISNLKIDRSFFAEIESDQSSRSIVAAIIAMSKTLNMTVTAEGVENEQQMDFLRRHDCDFAQGYLISPPVQAHEFEALVTDTDGHARSTAR